MNKKRAFSQEFKFCGGFEEASRCKSFKEDGKNENRIQCIIAKLE